MIETSPYDTPIKRASILDMPIEELEAYIERIRERRLQAYSTYLLGVEVAKKRQYDKSVTSLQADIEKFEKVHATALNSIAKLEKYANDMKVQLMIQGEYSFGDKG